MKRQREERESESEISICREKETICPVCRKESSDMNLPDAPSAVEDDLNHSGGACWRVIR